MPREADEPDLALRLGPVERFDDAAAREMHRRLVVERHFVDLPEIQMVGLQSAQRILELAHRDFGATSVRADLRHQKDLVAPADERLAHALFTQSRVVVPGVVHERDAAIHCGLDESGREPFGLLCTHVPAPERENRDLEPGGTEGSCRNE